MFYIFTSFIIVNYLTTIISGQSNSNYSDFKLELVQTLFRHGDRTPDEKEMYPNDPYNASVYEPYGYGQLTNKGMQRVYHLGVLLRERYGTFLGNTYRPKELYAYSDYLDRTKSTLQLVLAGLYPPSPELTWNVNISWMPIPTDYGPPNFNFQQTIIDCPEFQRLFWQVIALSEVQLKLAKYKDFIQYLTDKTGKSLDAIGLIGLYSLLMSQEHLDLPRPDWCTQEILQELEDLVALVYNSMSHTKQQLKVTTGATLKRFIRNIMDSESKNNTRKIYLYSSRDLILHTFTRAHGLTIPKLIEYGSCIIIEKLRGKDNQIYIRLLLWSGVSEQMTTLKLKNCDEICPWIEYLRILEPVLPEGEGTECLYENAYGNVKSLINGLPLTNGSNRFRYETLYLVIYTVSFFMIMCIYL